MAFATPVRPRLSRLPFHDPALTWEGFEDFCLDYVSRRSDVLSAHFYGTRGSKQKGIDIFANMTNGERWAFQCRHWKKITPANVQKTVREATYSAARFVILLSSDATTAARDECDRHEGWDIWDGRDLSREVRSLPLDEGRALLDAHFGPAIRREFLGLDAVSAFLLPERFFARFLNDKLPFHHGWQLVGREAEMAALNGFVSSQRSILILPGRGGSGKSKLIHALAQDWALRHQGMDIRFLADSAPLTPSSLDELPLRPCIVVVDDAHRVSELPLLLEAAAQRATQAGAPPIKLLLLTRPAALDSMRAQAHRSLGTDAVTVLPELGDLAFEDVERLAAQALGPRLAVHAMVLAKLTRDCPLVTTVAGRLLALGQVDFGLLERSEEFRRVVLDRFRDEMLGRVEGIQGDLALRLLDLIAAVAPVRLNSPEFVVALAEFAGAGVPETMRALDALEQGGVLVRRGDRLRITPDVLSDQILHRACLSSSGQSTTYGEAVFGRFASLCLPQVLGNLAELDWRFQAAHGRETRVLDAFWRQWREEFEISPASMRAVMLDILKRIAPYQPGPTLALVEMALEQTRTPDAPGNEAEDAERLLVLDALPGVLRGVASSRKYLGRCCDLLWRLGRDDIRAQHQLPDHPLRVLKELAAYDLGKPLEENEIVFSAVERWLEEPDAHSHAHSPLDVLKVLLAKSATSDFSHDFQVTMRAFMVSPHTTQALRERALSRLESCIRSGGDQVLEAAIQVVDVVLHEPVSYFDMHFSEEEPALWKPEQKRGLDLLAQAVAGTSSPFSIVKAGEVLAWHLEHGSPELRTPARELFESLPEPFEARLLRCLSWRDRADHARAGLMLEQKSSGAEGEDEVEENRFRLRDKIENERFERCLVEFLERYPDPANGMAVVEQMVHEIERRGQRGGWDGAGRFLFRLAKRSDDYGAWTCEAVLENPDSSLRPSCCDLLVPLRERDEARAHGLAARFAGSERVEMQLVAASAYSYPAWRNSLKNEDWSVLEVLASSQHLAARHRLLRALHRMDDTEPLQDRRRALELVLSVDVEDNQHVADEMAALFAAHDPTFPLDSLSDDEVQRLLQKLVAVNEIDEHHVRELLAQVARRLPLQVLQFLLARLEHAVAHAEKNQEAGTPNHYYSPVPFDLEDALPLDLGAVAEHPLYEAVLRQLCEETVGARGSKAFWLPRLFRCVSLNHAPQALQVLEEWTNQFKHDPEHLNAASLLLSNAPSGFVLEHVEFVTHLLRAAHAISRDCFHEVGGHIWMSLSGGTYIRSAFQASERHTYQRDDSRCIAQNLPIGSPEREFYEWLSKDAEREIEAELKRDAERADE